MIVLASPASESELQLDPENPWPGLASYDEVSHRFFSGRAAESDEALRRIVDEPVTVLFGKSGLGKTSLLNAGVFPSLRKRDMLPVVVRLHVRDASGPLIEQAYQRLIEEFRLHRVEHPDRAGVETLWEYLHRAARDFWTPQNRLVRPVFVFDQFEELFTLGRAVPAQVEGFREDLADLAENRIPAAAVRQDNALDNDVRLNTRTMPYHIVIALREDFLADLEGWRATMPSLRRNRMRLLPMRSNQALEAVCNERTNHLVSEALARKIVTYLSSCGSPEAGDEETVCDGTVEPALLSLFCRGINEQRKREGKGSFDPALLEGAKGTLVRDFYVDCLADQPARVRRFIEDELVTESGYRNSYSVKDAINGGVITESQLDALINRHLLRHEHHLGTDRVELTHDLLTRAVVEERDRRVLADRVRRDRRHRLKFRSLAAACAIIVAVFAGLWLRASAARREADVSLVKADTARAEAQKAQTIADDLRKTAEDHLLRLHKADSDLRQALEDANEQRDRATTEKNRSQSRELAAHAEAAMHADPELAIALGLRAIAHADTVEARSALIDVARYAWPYADLYQADLGGIPRALAISGGGERLVVLAGRNAISVWDVTRRKPLRLWPDAFPASSKLNEDDAAASVAFSPDEKVIAVGRRRGIDLVDAKTGRVSTTLSQFTDEVEDRRIVFSPDGQWLASSQADGSTLLLAKLGDPPALSEVIKTSHEIGGFAVLRGGQAIVTVGGRPLAAHEFSKRDGTWHENTFDLMSCVRRQSVSPGSEYVSATWTTSACMIRVDQTRASIPRDSRDGTTEDIVWSNGGAAFTELVGGRQGMLDLVVGRRTRSGELTSRIKGAHPMGNAIEKSRLVSVSETATRVALIDADDHELVRIYSVGGFKPFMSAIESAFAVAPDGSWMAIGRPGVGSGEQTATINVVPLEHAFTPDQLSLARVRIAVNRIPTRLYASSNSIVAVHDEANSETTSVFDAFTGERRFEPLSGLWRPLGSAGEMLLFTGNPQRIVKTVDGAPIEQWNATPGVDEFVSVRVSPSEGALAVFRQAPRRTGPINATLYSVRRDSLRLTGRVTNLPRSWNSMVIAEDAHSLAYGGKVWHITKGGVTTAATGAAGQAGAALASPLGRFEVQQDVKDSDDSTYTIINRRDRSVIATAQRYRFSDDDRWLAAVRDGMLTVYDLSRGGAIFKLAQPVDSMTFAGQGILHVRFSNASMLIPLDWRLMERFLQWLTTRTLTPREECGYRLRTKECRNELPLRAQKAAH